MIKSFILICRQINLTEFLLTVQFLNRSIFPLSAGTGLTKHWTRPRGTSGMVNRKPNPKGRLAETTYKTSNSARQSISKVHFSAL